MNSDTCVDASALQLQPGLHAKVTTFGPTLDLVYADLFISENDCQEMANEFELQPVPSSSCIGSGEVSSRFTQDCVHEIGQVEVFDDGSCEGRQASLLAFQARSCPTSPHLACSS